MRDCEFIRGSVPMTKEEIRHIVVAKLNLKPGDVLYDIGCGTGSVICEAAAQYDITGFGIEINEEAVELSRKNAEKFGLNNITIISGMAPEAIPADKKPTHAFIGGSKGRLSEILDKLYEINSEMRVVITAVSMETVAELSEIEEKYSVKDMNIVMVQISNVTKMGSHHMLKGENPIYICDFYFVKK